jgi:mono/diheme cytochrome c family protein
MMHAFKNTILRFVHASVMLLTLAACLLPCHADEGVAFFEKKIRPVLIEHCYECHSEQAKTLKGGLRVDSSSSLMQGGDSGPIIINGRPSESLLVDSLKYKSTEMPPSGKLPDATIADFEHWIEMGVPAPIDKAATVKPDKTKKIDFEEAREH